MPRERGEPPQVPHFTITKDMHPQTADIVVRCRALVAEYARGETNWLPTQLELGEAFGVSRDTIESIQRRLRVAPIFAMGRKADKDGIRGYYESSLRKFASEETDEIPSNPEVASVFECSIPPVVQAVSESKRDLQNRLKLAREEAKSRGVVFRKNDETAWFLGAMFGAGSLKVSQEASGLIFTHADSDVREIFKAKGEAIIRGKEGQERKLPDRDNLSIVFNHVGYAKLLAPFSIESRTRLMLKQYNWVQEDENLLRSFVTGWFDAAGSVYFASKTNRGISFATHNNEDIADYCCSTLKLFGIPDPKIVRNGKVDTRPKKVRFGMVADLKLFVDKIVPSSRAKQEVFAQIRDYELTRGDLIAAKGRNRKRQIFP